MGNQLNTFNTIVNPIPVWKGETKWKPNQRKTWSDPSIFAAIDDNDCQRIIQLVKSGHNVNKRDSNGLTALHLAAINGNEQCLEVLINLGALLRSCPLRQTSLHFAAQNGTKNMINMLLDYGSVINCKDTTGATPLANAVETNNMETAAALLSRGAILHPNVCVSALQSGFTQILKLLLNFRPIIIESIELKDEFRFTRVTETGLKILFFAGLPLNQQLLKQIEPWDWQRYCLGSRMGQTPPHYKPGQDIPAFDAFQQWFDANEEPISLKCLSRIAFRKACNANSIETALSHLRVPIPLQNYILLNDIID